MSVAVIERNDRVSAAVIERNDRVGTDTIEEGRRSRTEIAVGSRVWVTGSCPFRGLRGSVLQAHLMEDSRIESSSDEPPYGVYQVQLDEVSMEPIWMLIDDIDLLFPVAIR